MATEWMAKALVSCTSPDAVPSWDLETTLLDSSQELVFAALRGAFEVPFFLGDTVRQIEEN